jgi:hypothetical protein
MLNVAQVVAIIEQTAASVVVCDGVGDDPMVASGLLLVHLDQVAKQFRPERPQVWRLRPAERTFERIGRLKQRIEDHSGQRVDDYKLSEEVIQRPLLPDA